MFGCVDVSFSIDIPEGTEDEIKFVVNTIKEKIKSLSGDNMHFHINEDAEWGLAEYESS